MQSHDDGAATCTSFAPFVCVVRDITMEVAPGGMNLRWQRDALVALQFATEDFLVMIFEMTYVPVCFAY